MKLNIKKPSKSVLLAVIITLVLAGTAASAATYFLVDKQDGAGQDLVRNSGPQNGDSPEVPTAKVDASLPEGTLSPKSVALEPQKYSGKEIKVRGRIVEFTAGQYSIIGQEADQPVGLRVDFSKSNLDPKPFAAPTPGSKVEADKQPGKDPVTVTGTIEKTEANGALNYTFVAKSIDK